MNYKLLLSFLIIFIVFESCSFESELVPEEESNVFYKVDPLLWDHFIKFEQEALRRGFEIDLNALEISGEIKNIPETGVAGTCQYGQHISHVTVDQSYWNQVNVMQREFVVFHELGHCVLHRGHFEGQFDNGICQSLMRSGLGNCRDAYTLNNRSYYLDELFSVLE